MSLQDNTYPLVSVVVPAYNAETRIAYALESIIAQDYPNLEIIVVNDASTDATEDIARRVLEGCGHPFTIVTHKKNRGVSAARNTGIEAAQGEFIGFMDSDDMAESNLLSTLYNLIKKDKCDISFCGYKEKFVNGEHPDILLPVKLKSYNTQIGEELLWLRVLSKISPHVCGMLFRKQFLAETGLRFQEGCTAGEDVEFQLKAFCRAKQVAVAPDCLYIYMHHAEMGTIRDNNNKEKQIRRYRDHTDAHFREAQYLSEHAPSDRIKNLADYFLLPQAIIRSLTLCARMHERARFDAILAGSDTRKTLSASKKFLFQKPEVYGKAFSLLHFPGIYYRLRSK